jgi:PEP-CTERM motif-containing protein
MKRIVAIITVCVLLAASGATWAYTVSLSPSSQHINVGDAFAVNLNFSRDGVTTSALSNFDVGILFNNSQMAFTGYILGTGLGVLGTDALDLSWGANGNLIDLAELSLLPQNDPFWNNQPDKFTLATLDFRCLASGTSLIQIDANDPYLTFGDQYANLLGVTVGPAVTIEQGTTVPEPSTLLLLCGGLAATLGLRRIKNRK